MKPTLVAFRKGFSILAQNSKAQTASMVIPVGGQEGGRDNRHRGSDQWLYVVSGKGEARINAQVFRLRRRHLLLIERGENHEIRNTGTTPLVTLNLYVPPAYTPAGEELPRGKP